MGTHTKPEKCAVVIARIAAQLPPDACPGCGESPCIGDAEGWRYVTVTDRYGIRSKHRINIFTGERVDLIEDYKRVRFPLTTLVNPHET